MATHASVSDYSIPAEVRAHTFSENTKKNEHCGFNQQQ